MQRSINIIDIENLFGGTDPTADDVRDVWTAYNSHGVTIEDNDHVVVASCSRVAKVAWFALPASGLQRVVRDGPDGADLAALSALDLPHAATRYDRLVIASGDHAFAPVAEEARSLGMAVHLVIGRGAPSRELLRACPSRTWLRLDESVGLSAYRAGTFARAA